MSGQSSLQLDSDRFQPLLLAYRRADDEFAVTHALSMLGSMASQVLKWLMGLGVR